MVRGPFGGKRPFVDPKIEIVFSVDTSKDFGGGRSTRKNKRNMTEKAIKSRAKREFKREGVYFGGIEVNLNTGDGEVRVSGNREDIPHGELNYGISILEQSIEESDMNVRSIKISAS